MFKNILKQLKDKFYFQRYLFNTSHTQIITNNTEKIQKWLSNLNQRASSPESRSYCAQLSSLIQYFNRKVDLENQQQIDWDLWKKEINTKDLVNKLQANFENLAKETYNVEKICEQVINTTSNDLNLIDKELTYHRAIWANCYSDYIMFLFELEEYGDAHDYLMHENYDFFYGLEADLEELNETHNYLPGVKDDINLKAFLAVQFAWGKKVISFYRHPADDFKCARGTKNILGR